MFAPKLASTASPPKSQWSNFTRDKANRTDIRRHRKAITSANWKEIRKCWTTFNERESTWIQLDHEKWEPFTRLTIHLSAMGSKSEQAARRHNHWSKPTKTRKNNNYFELSDPLNWNDWEQQQQSFIHKFKRRQYVGVRSSGTMSDEIVNHT